MSTDTRTHTDTLWPFCNAHAQISMCMIMSAFKEAKLIQISHCENQLLRNTGILPVNTLLHPLTKTHTDTHIHTVGLSSVHIETHSLSLTHTHTHSLTHSLTHAHIHTHKQTGSFPSNGGASLELIHRGVMGSSPRWGRGSK